MGFGAAPEEGLRRGGVDVRLRVFALTSREPGLSARASPFRDKVYRPLH
jgi:hypothetical protein